MKITEISGTNKIRDFKICYLWQEGKLTNQQIAEQFGISERCVARVVYKNRGVLKTDRNWEKAQRIKWLKQQLNKCGDSRKDPLEIQEAIRKELEGENKLVDNSTKNYYTVIQNLHERSKQPSRIVVD